MKNILKKIPIAIILCSTLVLLVVVGFGEARRTYIRFRLETSILQSDTVIDIIEPFLEAGFPITMYSGYDNMASIVSKSNDDVICVQILDVNKNEIYSNIVYTPPSDIDQTKSKIEVNTSGNVEIYESGNIFKIQRDITLENGIKAGELVIYLNQENSTNYISKSYKYVFIALIVCCIILILFFYIATSNFKESTKKAKRNRNIFIKVLYVAIFLFLGLFVTLTTMNIYEKGVRGKTDAIGKMLTERFIPVNRLGIEFEDLSNINNILTNFKERYSFVESVSINRTIYSSDNSTEKQEIKYGSNESRIGDTFHPDEVRLIINYISIDEAKGKPSDGSMETLKVVVSVPKTEVRKRVFNSIINFIALIIGASLIAMIFLNVGLAYTESLNAKAKNGAIASPLDPAVSLQLIKAAYFLVVFVSSMAVPFLPMLVRELNGGTASAVPFTIYYLFFALILIPAGNASAKGKIKQIMALGFIAEVVGCILVARSYNIPLLTVGRAISGLGQGCFLIGFQSYVLSVTPKEKRTQGAAIKVIARNSALIGGTAIGSLLYVFMGFRNLFFLSSVISIIGFIYLVLLVPRVKLTEKTGSKKLEIKNISKVFKDKGFLKVLFLTGIPAKMGITGVVSYAIPLLLASLSFAQEAIGQFLMLFFLISMFVTKIAAKHVDKSGNTHSVLFLSAVMGGVGMLLIGYQGLVLEGSYQFIAVIGLLIMGVANGLVSAPIVTQITKTKSAEVFGYSPMIAVYTFLERFGHIMGPMVLSFIIALAGNKTSSGIGIFGIVTLVLGFIFLLTSRKQSYRARDTEIDERTVSTYKRLEKLGEQVFHGLKRVSNYSVLSLDVMLAEIEDGQALEHDVKDFILQTGIMHEIINDEKGLLLRYRGPNMQASWNSVLSQEHSVKSACDAALVYFKKLEEVKSLRESGNSIQSRSTIGIHCENSVILNHKQQQVKENIIIGRTLLTSEYLSTLNEKYGTKIIISNGARKHIKTNYVCRFLDIIKVPGSRKKMRIYELNSSIKDEISNGRKNFIKLYEAAFYYFIKKEWQKAKQILDLIRKSINGKEKSVELLNMKILLAKDNPSLTENNWIGYLDV